MVLATERTETRVSDLHVAGESIPKIDPKATVKFVEAITGRRIRKQIKVDYAKIHAGEIKLHGDPVEQYIYPINNAFRDHPDFDVIAGSSYTKIGRGIQRAVVLLIRPGISDLDRAMLAGSIPASVPLDVRFVYREWNNLTPDTKLRKRVTHTNHRLQLGDDPKLRLP